MRPLLIDPATPMALQQTSLFVTAMRRLGRSAEVQAMNDVGQAIVIKRKFTIGPALNFTSRGPVWRPDALPTDRVAALQQSALSVINAPQEDAAVLRAAGFRMVATPVTQAILPLFDDPDRQMRQARGKWRNAARQLDRRGLRVAMRPLTDDRIGWLLAADRLQQRQKRYRALPDVVTRALCKADPGQAQLYCATRGNTVHAAMLILRHGTMATYHIGWSDAQGRRASAHHAMVLYAAQHLARLGVTQLDLGTFDTARAPGLARFKIGTGARLETQGGTWLRLRPWRW